MQLWIVRHAQPLIAPGLCYGTLDVPADAQATQAAAQTLALSLPKDAVVHCSTLQRCELLARHLIGLRPDLSLHFDARLREMDFGSWEGQRWDSLPPQALKDWTDDFENYRCGGTGESTGQFVARVYAALQHAWPAAPEQGSTVWITHAGVARAIDWLHQQKRATPPWAPLCPPLCLSAHAWPQHAPGFGQSVCWNLSSHQGPA